MPTSTYITAEEFGMRQQPELPSEKVIKLCREGQIPGAFKMPGDKEIWMIPEYAEYTVTKTNTKKRKK